ncbi:hypothetical protein PAPYR_3197 [Paratrimastix pyriformis]|uniref:Uncharacterized protein n=1 Tax=Paratrimastix pyriformis TaxID=342808 RepID=A0ABQ8USQ7_9EUKA|nr:hypothetical protein PAPYR_3197 [Paratrimastix pyriformis]
MDSRFDELRIPLTIRSTDAEMTEITIPLGNKSPKSTVKSRIFAIEFCCFLILAIIFALLILYVLAFSPTPWGGVHCMSGAPALPYMGVLVSTINDGIKPILVYETPGALEAQVWVGQPSIANWTQVTADGPATQGTPYPRHFAFLPPDRVACLVYTAGRTLELYTLSLGPGAPRQWDLIDRTAGVSAAPWGLVFLNGSLVWASARWKPGLLEADGTLALANFTQYEALMLKHPVEMVAYQGELSIYNGWFDQVAHLEAANWTMGRFGTRKLLVYCRTGHDCMGNLACPPAAISAGQCGPAIEGLIYKYPHPVLVGTTRYRWAVRDYILGDSFFSFSNPAIFMHEDDPEKTFEDCHIAYREDPLLARVGDGVFYGTLALSLLALVPTGLAFIRRRKRLAAQAAGAAVPGGHLRPSPAPVASPSYSPPAPDGAALAPAGPASSSPSSSRTGRSTTAPLTLDLFRWVVAHLGLMATLGYSCYLLMMWVLPPQRPLSPLGWALRLPMFQWFPQDTERAWTSYQLITILYLLVVVPEVVWGNLFRLQRKTLGWALAHSGPDGSPSSGGGGEGAPSPSPSPPGLGARFVPNRYDLAVMDRFSRHHRCWQYMMVGLPVTLIGLGCMLGQLVSWAFSQLRFVGPSVWLSLTKSAMALATSQVAKQAAGWAMARIVTRGSLLHARFSQQMYISTLSVSVIGLQVYRGQPNIEREAWELVRWNLLQIASTVGLMEGLLWLGEICTLLLARGQTFFARAAPQQQQQQPKGRRHRVGCGCSWRGLPRLAVQTALSIFARTDPAPHEDWKPMTFLYAVFPYYLMNVPVLTLVLPPVGLLVLGSFWLRGRLFARPGAAPADRNAHIWQGLIFSSLTPVSIINCVQAISYHFFYWEPYDPSDQMTMYYPMKMIFLLLGTVSLDFYLWLLQDRVLTRALTRHLGPDSVYLQFCVRPSIYGTILPPKNTAAYEDFVVLARVSQAAGGPADPGDDDFMRTQGSTGLGAEDAELLLAAGTGEQQPASKAAPLGSSSNDDGEGPAAFADGDGAALKRPEMLLVTPSQAPPSL